jgi:hypothetical protein
MTCGNLVRRMEGVCEEKSRGRKEKEVLLFSSHLLETNGEPHILFYVFEHLF